MKVSQWLMEFLTEIVNRRPALTLSVRNSGRERVRVLTGHHSANLSTIVEDEGKDDTKAMVYTNISNFDKVSLLRLFY